MRSATLGLAGCRPRNRRAKQAQRAMQTSLSRWQLRKWYQRQARARAAYSWGSGLLQHVVLMGLSGFCKTLVFLFDLKCRSRIKVLALLADHRIYHGQSSELRHYRRLFLVEPLPEDGWPRPEELWGQLPNAWESIFRVACKRNPMGLMVVEILHDLMYPNP